MRVIESSRVSAKLTFFKTFISNPRQVGSLLPSGHRLAQEITDPIDFRSAKVVVEFGPGTGSFTDVLIRRMKPGAKLIAVEVNHDMADSLERRYPSVDLVRDSAEHLRKHLDERGIEHVDAIVSGIPFALLPSVTQTKILDVAHDALRPGGLFLSFTYYHSIPMPATNRYTARLRRIFESVERVPVVRNFPPAFILRCTA
jgi:phosphatidylethanolamine/phosphatidyl-N-methylethanolamine N-methyltransferase